MPQPTSSPSLSASIRALAEQIDARMDAAATPPSPEPAPAGDPTPPAPTPEPQPSPQGDPQPPADSTDWKAQSRKHEDRAKAAAKTLEQRDAELAEAKARTEAILKAAGLAPDVEDPAEAAKRALGERDAAATERDALRTEVLALKRERLIEGAARAAGADIDRVRDSRAVADAVRALDADATDADVANAVTTAVTVTDAAGSRTVTPAFAALAHPAPTGPRPPAAGPGQGASGNPPRSLEDRAAEAAKGGQHRSAIGLQIAKLAVPAA